MKSIFLILPLAALSACTTPKTVLRNEDTGQVAVCGGNTTSSLFGGALGYYIQKSSDADCTADYLKQGFDVSEKEEATSTQIVEVEPKQKVAVLRKEDEDNYDDEDDVHSKRHHNSD